MSEAFHESLHQGIEAARRGHRLLARLHLARAVQQQPDDHRGWAWLAWVSESPAAACEHLQRALRCNPDNEIARAGLNWTKVLAEWDYRLPASPREMLAAVAEAEASAPPAPVRRATPLPQRPATPVPAPAPAARIPTPLPVRSATPIPQRPATPMPAAAAHYAPLHSDPLPAALPSVPEAAADPEPSTADSFGEPSPFDSILRAPSITLEQLRAQASALSAENVESFIADEPLTGLNPADTAQSAISVRPRTSPRREPPPAAAPPASTVGESQLSFPAPTLELTGSNVQGFEMPAQTPLMPAPGDSAMTFAALANAPPVRHEPEPSPFDSILKAPTVTLAELKAAAQQFHETGVEGFSMPEAFGPDSLEEAIKAPTQSLAAVAAEAAAPPPPELPEPTARHAEATDSQFVSLAETPLVSDSMTASQLGLSSQLDGPAAAAWNANGDDAPRKIMIVDDSPTVCKIVSITLRKRGYQVMTAGDGVEAMAQLATAQPDLILLDITMPRMDGYQLCKLIKGYPSTKHIPVVMLSGKDGFFDRVRGKLVGCADYLTKPFDPEALVTAIERYLPQPAGAPAL